MQKIKNILFDLDGTISDPQEGIINGIYYSAKKLGLKTLERSVLEKFIGPPLHHSYQEKFNLSEEEAGNAVNVFREYYSEKGWSENVLLPNIREVIVALFENGYKLFVATSKPTFYAKKIIELFELDQYFSEIVGSNLDNTRSDKAEIIEYVIENNQLEKEECLMIGDTKFDITGAKKNELKSVAITTGFETKEELAVSEPDYIFDDCLEVLELIKPSSFQKIGRPEEIKLSGSDLKITAFSHPEGIENESSLINQLFEDGLDELVIRKPNLSDKEVNDLLDSIKKQFYSKIYVCDRMNLVSNRRLRGLHCSNAYYDSLLRMEQNELHQQLKEKGQKISISAHNPQEWEKRKGKFDQLYLCPIFESISKPGYIGSWDHSWIKEQINNNQQVESLVALGGICQENMIKVEELGFDGIGVLGTIWNDLENAIKNLKKLKMYKNVVSI